MSVLTVCRNGLVRSVALADVLKMHFRPQDSITMDVLAAGAKLNSEATKLMLYEWADHIVLMSAEFVNAVPPKYHHKTLICEVGEDTYGNSHNRELIDKVWKWAREHQTELGIFEHKELI